MKRLILSLILLATFVGTVGGLAKDASAVSPREFDAGRIIDDDIFYDKYAMGSAQAVQGFISNHTPACDTWGTQPSGYGGTRAEYAARMGWHAPPYVCLQNYYENPQTGETSFEKGGGAFSGGQNAGQIIWDAAQRHGINPQVLLVMLKKESAGPLFSDSWPLKNQYKYAMGYACPDSGPGYSANCESSKAGFYKQMDLAAWQLRRYANYIGEYNYQPGRWNYIQYSPDPACGGKNVYIENVATASLYIYTPYVPTTAALDAYPGTTNCGAYGNRNFFMFFNEWFGSTVKRPQLVRTVTSSALYLIVDGKKHRVPSEAIMKQLLPISGVDFVSQAYLDSKTTDIPVKRLIRDAVSGSIYLIDGGYKIKFGSCALISDYGYSCSDAVNLTDSQLNSFITADTGMTNVVATITGKRFYMQSGQRREMLDDLSAQASGLSAQSNRLSEASVEDIPYGVPVIRDDVVIRERGGQARYVRSGGVTTKFELDLNQFVDTISAAESGTLDGESISKIYSGLKSSGLMTDGADVYALTRGGKVKLPSSEELRAKSSSIARSFIDKIPGDSSEETPVIKSVDNPTLFLLKNTTKHPFITWDDVFSANPSARIVEVATSTASNFERGPVYIRPGELIKSTDRDTLYITLGDGKIQALPSFDPAVDIGHRRGIREVSSEAIAGLSLVGGAMKSKISCAGEKYIGIGKGITKIPNSTAGEFTNFATPEFCGSLAKFSPNVFVKLANSVTIYYVNTSGQKERLTSYANYAGLGGNSQNTFTVTQTGLNEFPDGPNR